MTEVILFNDEGGRSGRWMGFVHGPGGLGILPPTKSSGGGGGIEAGRKGTTPGTC